MKKLSLKKLLTPALAAAAPLLPFAAYAQEPEIDETGGIFNALEFVTDFINVLIPVLIAVAVVIVIFNVIKFIAKANDSEARKESTKGIIAGIIGIVVIVSIWGIVELLVRTFDLDNPEGDNIPVPQVPGPSDGGGNILFQ